MVEQHAHIDLEECQLKKCSKNHGLQLRSIGSILWTVLFSHTDLPITCSASILNNQMEINRQKLISAQETIPEQQVTLIII